MLKRGRYWLWKTYRAALKVDWNEKRLPGKCMSCHARIHLSKFWSSAGGGVGGLSLECDQKRNQKRDQANVKLRKLFPKILSQAEHEKFQPISLLIMFAPKRNATNMSGTSFPSLPYWVLFTPTPIVCTNGLSYADVITKFSGMFWFYSLLCMGLRCNLDKVLFK